MSEQFSPKRPINDAKDILLLSLKTFFSTHEEFTWSANSKDTVLTISDSFPVDREKKENYPTVILQRHDFTWRNRHLNQTSYNNLQDKRYGLDLLSGTFTCLCASTLGLEAERLAEDVFLFFTRFREIISAKGLFDVKNLSIGAEQVQRAGSDTDIVVVPVRLGVSIEDSWTVVENGPTLEDLNVSLKSIN
jgi:hypothetical protein